MLLCMYYTCADICTHAGNEINEITRYEAADVKFKKINQSNQSISAAFFIRMCFYGWL